MNDFALCKPLPTVETHQWTDKDCRLTGVTSYLAYLISIPTVYQFCFTFVISY